jgi:molybdenum cofactor biosynthesis protein B
MNVQPTTAPHPDRDAIALNCAIITVSDTRTHEEDRSGQAIQLLLQQAGHEIGAYRLIPDEPAQIQAELRQLCHRSDLDVLIFNGGTGIAPRDVTYEVIVTLLDKTLPGFGELFFFLSYQEIGSRAIASRATAGIYRQKLLFSLPGSTNAVKLALEKLIIPELPHLIRQLRTI